MEDPKSWSTCKPVSIPFQSTNSNYFSEPWTEKKWNSKNMWIIFHMWDKLEEFKGHTKHIFLRETAKILAIIALWMVLQARWSHVSVGNGKSDSIKCLIIWC